MAPTFGITRASIEGEFTGLPLDDLDSQITNWIAAYAASLSGELRARGYDATEVQAGDDLYSLCQQYLIHRVAERVASSSTLQYGDKAKFHAEQWKEIVLMIRTVPEAVSANWDRNEQQGSWRTHRTLLGDRTPRDAIGRRWTRGDKL